jgi:hypothetical protein
MIIWIPPSAAARRGRGLDHQLRTSQHVIEIFRSRADPDADGVATPVHILGFLRPT